MALLETIFGNYTKRNRKRIRSIVEGVNSRREDMIRMTQQDFINKTNEFRRRLRGGQTINDILIEALAVVREATRRVTGKEPYDVQIEAASAMNDGIISEMKTGEGKSLVQILIAYLNALEATSSLDKNEWTSVHIMTSNDALAKRDKLDNENVFKLLGLSCGFVTRKNSKLESKAAYKSDIIYATARTIAFDYLDDNVVLDKSNKVMSRKFGYAIIDEADDILFDQARTPLILSTSSIDSDKTEDKIKNYYIEATKLLNGEPNSIIPDIDHPLRGLVVERKEENNDFYEDYLYIKETGEIYLKDELEDKLFRGFDESSPIKQIEYNYIYDAIINCIKAKHSFINGKEYLLTDGEEKGTKKITLIDTNIGRFKKTSKYVGDIQYAIEAKEQYELKKNNSPYKLNFTKRSKVKAMITYPDFLKLYSHVCGMTGTSDREEFLELYGLETYEVPTRKEVRRKIEEEELYVSSNDKYIAIVKEIIRCKKEGRGQPILLGTTSVKESEELSKLLTDCGISHQLLNAKNEEEENRIIANAGQKNMVTISTNMAGRGTDIKLGKEVENVGLYVIGTSKNISERIDRQLIGRCARQGDPGKCKYFMSLDDEILSYCRGLKAFKSLYSTAKDRRIKNAKIIKLVNKAQSLMDSKNKQNRRIKEKYNKILNNHRNIIYEKREAILNSEPIDLLNYIKLKVIPDYCKYLIRNKSIDEMEGLVGHLIDVRSCYSKNSNEFLNKMINAMYISWYNENKNKTGEQYVEYVKDIRVKMLKIIDDYWTSEMDRLDELQKMLSYTVSSEDPLKVYETKANYEFSMELMPTIMNEFMTYAMKPNLTYGSYEINRNTSDLTDEYGYAL